MRIFGSRLIPAYTIRDGQAQFCDLVISNGFLYASDYKGGYHIYQLNTGMPRLVGFVKTSDEGGNGIAIVDKYLLAADGPKGITVIDISNPKAPREANSFATTWGTDIDIWKDYAILSDGQGGMKVFDISDLPNLSLLADIPRSGYWTHVYCSDGLIFGIDELFGVYAYRLETSEPLARMEKPHLPAEPAIIETYPNPFNSKAAIKFSLPEKMDIELSIYDIIGNKVTTLVKDKLPDGTYTFYWKADNYPSGTYFAVLATPKSQMREKLLFVK